MGLIRKAVKLLGCTAAALMGIAAAVLIFMSFMLVRVEDGSMLPELEPGSRVIALRTQLPVDMVGVPPVNVGDLVVFKAPYYEVDGKGTYQIRRVSGMKGGMVEVCCEEGPSASEKEFLSKEKILGKVIYNG